MSDSQLVGYHGHIADKDIPPLEPVAAPRDLESYQKQAMNIANGQLGSIFQTGLSLYLMVGNQLTFFSILFLLNFGFGPIRNILNVEQTFAPLQLSGVNLMTPKLIYILYNLVGVAIVLWKIKAMGLLPVTSADWISLIPSKTPAETAIFG